MELVHDADVTHKRKKKRKKRRETREMSSWIKVEPDLESVEALNKEWDVLTSSTNQLQDVSKEKKRKQKNREKNLKTDDLGEHATDGELKVVCDHSSGLELQDDGDQEVKHSPRKKRKKKSRPDTSEGIQSLEGGPGEKRREPNTVSSMGESASLSLSLNEHHLKCKKKEKKKDRLQLPDETVVDEEDQSPVTDFAKAEAVGKHHKRKRKAEGSLGDLINGVDQYAAELLHEDVRFPALSKHQLHVGSKKKKRKKEAREGGLETEDLGGVSTNGELEVVPDSSGLALQDDDHQEELKHISRRKKKKKKSRPDASEGIQSLEVCPGEKRREPSRLACVGESAPLSSLQTEHPPRKVKKKKKRQLQEPPMETTSNEERGGTNSGSSAETSGDRRRKKRKRKAEGSLQDLPDGDEQDGGQTSQGSLQESHEERRRRKRKKEANDGSHQASHYEPSQVKIRQDDDDGYQSPQTSSLLAAVEEKRHKKIKKKKVRDGTRENMNDEKIPEEVGVDADNSYQTPKKSSLKATVEETIHRKKKKKKVRGGTLEDLRDEKIPEEVRNDADDGYQSSKVSSMETAIDEERHKKRKKKLKSRKLEDGHNVPSQDHEIKDDANDIDPSSEFSLLNADGMRRKKRKKKAKDGKHENGHSEPALDHEIRDGANDIDMSSEYTLLKADEISYKKKKKKKKAKDHNLQDVHHLSSQDNERRNIKKKRKSLDNLPPEKSEDVINNSMDDTDRVIPILSETRAGDEKRREKKKKQVRYSDWMDSQDVEAKDVDEGDDIHEDVLTQSEEQSVLKMKRKKKKKHLSAALETDRVAESQEDPLGNVDFQEDGTLTDALPAKPKSAKSGAADVGPQVQATPKDDDANATGLAGRPRKRKATDGPSSSSLPNDNRPSSHDEVPAVEKRRFNLADNDWLWNQPSIVEDDREWQKDLPLDFEAYQLTSASAHRGNDPQPKEGIVLKRGRWTGIEDNILKENVHNFCKMYGVPDPKIIVLPFLYEDRQQIGSFLRARMYAYRICKGLRRRPYDVYIRSRKIFDDRNYKGVFTKEEKRQVKRFKEVYGNRWSLIGQQIERCGQSVLDWYRGFKIGRKTGTWTEKEKEQLRRAVNAVMEEGEQGDTVKGIPWREVHKMVPTRNLHQCCIEWKSNLCWEIGNRGVHKWNDLDSVKLIESVYGHDVTEESDIDWTELYKEFVQWAPSPVKLMSMWNYLTRSRLTNSNFMTFEDKMDQMYHRVRPLLQEKAQKLSHVKSKEFISDSDSEASDSDSESDGEHP